MYHSLILSFKILHTASPVAKNSFWCLSVVFETRVQIRKVNFNAFQGSNLECTWVSLVKENKHLETCVWQERLSEATDPERPFGAERQGAGHSPGPGAPPSPQAALPQCVFSHGIRKRLLNPVTDASSETRDRKINPGGHLDASENLFVLKMDVWLKSGFRSNRLHMSTCC